MGTIKDKAANGLFWAIMEKGGKQFIQFTLGIVIARHLTPADYGIVGMLAIFMAISGVLLDSGIESALVQKQNRTDEDISTAYYSTFAISIILYTILYISAPYISSFYKTPILTSITRVLSLTLIINSFYMPAMTLLSIRLDFKAQTVISLIALLAGGVLGIILAVKGAGPWALVYYSLAESLIRGILYQCYVHYIPHTRFSKNSFKYIFSFGTKILFANIVGSIYNNLYTLVIGRAFDAHNVGIFNRGKNFPESLTYIVSHSVVKVAYPIFSKFQFDKEKLQDMFLRAMQLEAFFLAPFFTGMILLAKPLVLLVLKDKWIECVPILQLLSIGSLWLPFIDLSTNLFYSVGRTDVTLKYQLIEKPIAIVMLFVSVPFGLKAMCIVRIISAFNSYLLYVLFIQHYFHVSFFSQFKNISQPILMSGIMAIAVFFTTFNIDSNIAKLCIGTLTGIFTYILIGLLLKSSSLCTILDFIKEKQNKKQAKIT